MPAGVLPALLSPERTPGLVRRAQARARVAVEVLVEEQAIVPGRVGLEPLVITERGAAAMLVLEEQGDEPPRQVVGDYDLDQTCGA